MIEAAEADYRMLKEKGKEGESIPHYHGYLDGCGYGYIKGKEYQRDIDIETIPRLYMKWLMIDGDKPEWRDYIIQAMED